MSLCREEIPEIQKCYRKSEDQGFTVLGVNSTVQDTPLEIVPFVNKSSLTFSFLLDETFVLDSKYDLHSRQSCLFINRITILEALHGGGTLVSGDLHVLKILPWLISTIPLFSTELLKPKVTGVFPVYHKNNYKTAGFQIEASKKPKPT